MMGNPYTLPDGLVQIAFSGGRSSGYMLHSILEANGGIDPARARVIFTNTGREMPQTLDFVQEAADRWRVPIIWLEYRPAAPFFEVVGHNQADRDGRPFADLCIKRKYLPNQVTRFCTTELKIMPAKRYLVSEGWKHWTSAIGIRADEPRRLVARPKKERWVNWHPLAVAGVTKQDVALFWRRQPFDLRLPNIRGTTPLGNCDGCFLKSEAAIAALARDYPERAAWWESMESRMSSLARRPSGATFSKRYSRREIREFVESQGDWIFDETTGALCQSDDGDCTG